jgi:glucose/arabinose dehydrogenase
MKSSRSIVVVGLLSLAFLGACTAAEGDDSTSTTQPSSSSSTSVATVTTTSTLPAEHASTTTTLSLDDVQLALVEIESGFERPVFLVASPFGAADLVVEQPGRIVRLDENRTVLLDITGDVNAGGERGLLGLAFHPDFDSNRLAYINYSRPDDATVIEEYLVGDDGMFDVASRKVILTIGQPAQNHNGGMIAFGPDGYLWIGMGDGGAADDVFGNGQRADTLLGAMLRIEVGLADGEAYSIPADNPFADGVGGAPEVWAIGLRNPWRFSFDGETVWIADVGQGATEEVDAVPASDPGLNLGWPIMEGSGCFESPDCDPSSFVLPVTEYGRDAGCSITGGYVYRGDLIPEIVGHYFYSDFCTGILRSFTPTDGDVDWSQQVGQIPTPSSFGVGGDGELYVLSHNGSVFRLERLS